MRRRRRDSVLQALEAVREVAPAINLTDLIVLLYVAENPGLNMIELSVVARLSTVTASRASRRLAGPELETALPPSSGLLDVKVAERDARGRALFLSEKGEVLIRRIDDAIRAQTLIEDMREPVAANEAEVMLMSQVK